MKRGRPRVEDFTIGWICALPIEFTAARVVLDEEYETIAEVAQYVLGRIGLHNVVVACLPSGQYGTNSATATVVELRTKFPLIKYCLMVGIGGGVPSEEHDIRLGDVVICRPQNQHGGVIQYDLGKMNPNGQHIRTGSLNAPPAVLGAAVSKLQSTYDMGTSQLSKYLNAFSELPKFQCRPLDTDLLFEPEYQHESGESCCNCQTQRIINRPLRPDDKVAVHFGLIASGNQVIKDGVTRDTLSAELGGVLCFEMEAAGLMNQFPCLVIRGICDYADSHKRKAWQPFAAASAAACTKELLSSVPAVAMLPAEAEENSQDSLLTRSLSTLRSSNLNSSLTTVALAPDQQQRYLDALYFESINSRHATIHSAHRKTCKWILSRPEYTSWLENGLTDDFRGFLWIKGKPGTGKSILMKYLLANTSKNLPEAVVTSFFFHARGVDLEKSVSGMYRSLLYQLLQKVPQLADVLALCPPKQNDTGALEWTIEALKTAFEHALLRLENKTWVIFIDALDEGTADDIRGMVSFFEYLGGVSSTNNRKLRTCFSSRHYPFVTVNGSAEVVLEDQDEHRQDLSQYLHSELQAGHNEFVDDIRQEILDRSSGIFLWAVLVVQILNAEYQKGNKHTMKKRLGEIPDGLERLFEDILTRDNHNKKELLLCVQWVLFALQPIKAEELYHAILAEADPGSIRPWNSGEVDLDDARKFVINCSKGLVEETKSKTRAIQFIHESVRDYFLKGKNFDIPLFGSLEDFRARSHDQLKTCCLTYCQKIKPGDHCRIPDPLPRAKSADGRNLRQGICGRFPLLAYAVKYLLIHADTTHSLGLDQKQFVQNFTTESWISLNNVVVVHGTHRFPKNSKLVYVLSKRNLFNLIRVLDSVDIGMDHRAIARGTPLYIASELGYKEVMRSLLIRHLGTRFDSLQTDVDAVITILLDNRRTKELMPQVRYDSLLDWALRLLNCKLWELLLPEGSVDPALSHGHHWWALLAQAASCGYHELLNYVFTTTDPLVRYVDFWSKEVYLYWGSTLNNTGIRRLQRFYPAAHLELQFETHKESFAWLCGCARGHVKVVEFLLTQPARGSYRSDVLNWQHALYYAASWGRIEVVTLLITQASASDRSFSNSQLSRAFIAAMAGHHLQTMDLLRNQGLDIMHKSCIYDIFIEASRENQVSLVEEILNNAEDSIVNTISAGEATFCAAINLHVETLKILRERGMNIDMNGNGGLTALSYAALIGDAELVRFLLQHEPNINSVDIFG